MKKDLSCYNIVYVDHFVRYEKDDNFRITENAVYRCHTVDVRIEFINFSLFIYKQSNYPKEYIERNVIILNPYDRWLIFDLLLCFE